MLSLSQWLWFVPVSLFQHFVPQSFPHCKVLYCSPNCFGPLDAWEINDAVQNLYEFISRP